MIEFRRTLASTARPKLGPCTLIPLLLLAVGIVSCSGCGGHQSSGSKVSGRVSLNGQPLPDGMITFMPQTPAPGLRTVSAMIANGEFAVPAANSLMPGSYRVAVTAQKSTGRKIPAGEGSSEMVDDVEDYIPPKYNAATTLSVEITGDTSDLEFPLQIP